MLAEAAPPVAPVAAGGGDVDVVDDIVLCVRVCVRACMRWVVTTSLRLRLRVASCECDLGGSDWQAGGGRENKRPNTVGLGTFIGVQTSW